MPFFGLELNFSLILCVYLYTFLFPQLETWLFGKARWEKNGQSRRPTYHNENVNETRRDKKRGDETQAAHTNYCNKQIYIKAS